MWTFGIFKSVDFQPQQSKKLNLPKHGRCTFLEGRPWTWRVSVLWNTDVKWFLTLKRAHVPYDILINDGCGREEQE